MGIGVSSVFYENFSFLSLLPFLYGVSMKEDKLNKLKKKYINNNTNNTFIILKTARKTIRYIEKNTINFPNTYKVLRNRIIDSCYKMLENIYRANIFQDINDKKEIVVSIEMLNFYLEEAYIKDILTNKKYISYTNHLIELDKMVRSWFNYEKSK